jgi:hypothetical protein
MENLFVLPTDKPSRLIKNNHSQLLLTIQTLPLDREICCFPQNIYITSAEEIKDGEYGLSRLGEIIKFHSGYDYRYYAKIILTTDQDLIKDGVQAIDDDFLKWFVKNPSCESVAVKQELGVCLNCEWNYDSCPNTEECLKDNYKIIIPQEEPKQENALVDTYPDLDKLLKDKKQETLEEVAERFYGEEEIVNDYDISGYLQSAFLTGAKWQQEQDKNKYSEEEVRNIANWAFGFYRRNDLSDSELEDEFDKVLTELFKKK